MRYSPLQYQILLARTASFTDALLLWDINTQRDHNYCGVFIFPSLLGSRIICFLSHGIVRVLFILMILGAITHNLNVTVGLHFLFAMANHSVAFGHANSSLFHYRCRPFFAHSVQMQSILHLVRFQDNNYYCEVSDIYLYPHPLLGARLHMRLRMMLPIFNSAYQR